MRIGLVTQGVNNRSNNKNYTVPFLPSLTKALYFLSNAMKKANLRLLSVAVFALIAAPACKKDKDSGDSGKFSATINGTAWQPSKADAFYENDFITIGGRQVQLNDSLALSLDIPDTAHVNIPISFDNGKLTYTKSKSGAIYISWGNSSHGATILSSWDKTNKKVTGKFSGVVYSIFSASDSIVITNGQFNINYQ